VTRSLSHLRVAVGHPDDEATERGDGRGSVAERKWWTLLAVCVATFMLLLDITVVNVALPAIREELDASFTELQWWSMRTR
jgi:hypothetical protein